MYNLKGKNRHLAIFGNPIVSINITLGKVLKKKNRQQPLIVVDYQGLAAESLNQKTKGNLHKTKTLWIDANNRRKPVSIFRLRRSPYFRKILFHFFEQAFKCLHFEFSKAQLVWLVDFSWRITGEGVITLGALLQSLRNPQVVRWVANQSSPAQRTDRFIEALETMLQYPGVWSLSEGNNYLDIVNMLDANGTVWIECHARKHEIREHRVMTAMIEAIIVNSLCSLNKTAEAASELPACTIFYAFPNTPPLSAANGLTSLIPGAEHIGIFYSSSAEKGCNWPPSSTACWVIGSERQFTSCHDDGWFSEKEQLRLKELKPGQIWARPTNKEKAVTYRVKYTRPSVQLAHLYRMQANKRLKMSGILQFSSAVSDPSSNKKTYNNLYKNLCDKEYLRTQWLIVRKGKKDSHGIDGITIEQFGLQIEDALEQLSLELTNHSYTAAPLRVLSIPKQDGTTRDIKIGCVRDRVVQQSIYTLLAPLFEPRFSKFSFAFRPGRNAHQAIEYVSSLINSGKKWAVVADIQKCFDSIDHDILLKLISKIVADTDILNLIRQWLQTDFVDFYSLHPSEFGVPQGDVLSPLLSNIYLHSLDKYFEIHGFTFSRYADDFVILCDSEENANTTLKSTKIFLQEALKLSIKQDKTDVCALSNGIEYLGFKLTDKSISVIEARIKKLENKLYGVIRSLASKKSTLATKSNALVYYNALVRGVRNYYTTIKSDAIDTQMKYLDRYVEGVSSNIISDHLAKDPAWVMRQRFFTFVSSDREVNNLVATLFHYYEPQDSLIAIKPQADKNIVVDESSSEESSEADIKLEHKHLYLNGNGQYVSYKGNMLVVKKRKQLIYEIAFSDFNMLFLQGHGLTLSADLALKLSECGIIVILAPSYGKPVSTISPISNKKSHLRRTQAIRSSAPDVMSAGISMLSAKIGNQASVIQYFARYKKRTLDDLYHSLSGAANQIRELAKTVKHLDLEVAGIKSTVMGYEGKAAAIYWSAVSTLIPKELCFVARQTRYASDVVNQSLNYLYGMLYGEVWRAVVDTGLDPYFGIIHGSERDQGSLVFDLIEEFRAPFVDRLLLGMIGRGFSPKIGKNDCLLKKPKRQLVDSFLKQWNKEISWHSIKITPARLLVMQTRNLAKLYTDSKIYKPFQYRW
jgi:group II intron reverse transcriptase/maturase/CRISPR-associated endonuclease Cas1